MDISFSFENGNEIDANEPLGSAVITHGTQTINAKTVFLDAFLAALVTAYQTATLAGIGVTDVEGEHDSVTVERKERGLTISYGEQYVAVKNGVEFETSLRNACKDFLVAVEHETTQNELLEPIRAFVRTSMGSG